MICKISLNNVSSCLDGSKCNKRRNFPFHFNAKLWRIFCGKVAKIMMHFAISRHFGPYFRHIYCFLLVMHNAPQPILCIQNSLPKTHFWRSKLHLKCDMMKLAIGHSCLVSLMTLVLANLKGKKMAAESRCSWWRFFVHACASRQSLYWSWSGHLVTLLYSF